ncbi:long-chain-fatty-acid--CoA ligase [Nocardiopsis sp. HNM0947]|uniref:Long-chain-fatty-acid--CoA ligase n=1 Tax=Nocardiopsis coralli TaxID=2772213 RepID=A0ABR9P0Y6_9ACTN|nr:long-chain-fatty-acid--CoA ligase [Nocardiopsis coralli]MBE2997519.1 long-chain-fatty-acid--CoA ligase [Nocardiopsis coralli]
MTVTPQPPGIAASVARIAGARPDTTALVYEGDTTTFAELERRTAEFAAGLAAAGLKRGDRIAYLGLNSATLLETLVAATRIGAVFVPVNFRLAAPEVEVVLADAGPRVLVVEEGHRELVEQIVSRLPTPVRVLVDTDPHVPAADPAPGWERLSRVADSGAGIPAPATVGSDELAVLMYTSGTTGRPKGVVLTHGNLWWNQLNVASAVGHVPGETTYAAAPMFHIGGLNALTLGTLSLGGTVVVRRSFDPAAALTDLTGYRINTVFAVPAMYAAIARQPGFADADLSELRAPVVAGAPVPPSLVLEYEKAGVRLQQAWGLTETAPFATFLPPHLSSKKPASAGTAMPYGQVRLVDPATGTPVTGPGAAGEVEVRGPNVTPGYWHNEEATRAAFRDGWFRSGDIGHVDADGDLFIVDRLKDMVISGGENVYPAEVERVLVEHPRVTDAAVVGRPDPDWGERVVAVVSCTGSGPEPTLEEVREHCGHSLARYKLPRSLLVTDAVPRNASGKLDKRHLREWVSRQEAARDRQATGAG